MSVEENGREIGITVKIVPNTSSLSTPIKCAHRNSY